MKRTIILSIVVIATLAIAGLSGIQANFSDSEELGSKLQAGSLDLKVDNNDDPNVLPLEMKGIVPEKSYHFGKTVKNMGTIDGWLYIHFKDVKSTEDNDKDNNRDGLIDALDKPEPEKV